MLAAGAKVAYEKEKTIGWLSLVVAMSSAATVYQLYWDFVKDWGLLQVGSKNPWLRNELILRRKFIYFLSMVFHSLFQHRHYKNVLSELKNICKDSENFNFSGIKLHSKVGMAANCSSLQFRKFGLQSNIIFLGRT